MPTRYLLILFTLTGSCWLSPMTSFAAAGEPDQAYVQLRGKWQAVQLVDNGRVVPEDAIHTWMPCGGQVEVIDNTFVFTSPSDGQRHARVFDVDATRYPCEINFRAEGQLYAYGVYQLDQGRWIICAAAAKEVSRPTDFSSSKGSRRVLLVLKRTSNSAGTGGERETATAQASQPASKDLSQLPPPPTDSPQPTVPPTDLSKLPPPPDLRTPSGNTGRVLTDADVRRMLLGTWKYRDIYGDFFLTLDANGAFNTYRETAKTSAFQQVFVRAPVSSGNWVLNNGQVTFRCTASVHPERVNLQVPLMVRSISDNDLIFLDLRGQVGKAVKVR